MTHTKPSFTPFAGKGRGAVPTRETCQKLWREYGMLENIQTHSSLVASIAVQLGTLAQQRGWNIGLEYLQAAALLHDLGKTHSIRFGGNHCQLGAAWTMQATGNPAIAQGVMHHVYWPGPLDPKTHFLPLAVLYADKRVRHDEIVSVRQRFDDIRQRYGRSPRRCAMIETTRSQALKLEQSLSTAMGVDLHAYSFDCRGLVERT
ncbi:MAG: HD domain-containing protein [Desulfohalobium sp.]